MGERRELIGHYFPYCQFCEHDENCILRHHEYLGLPSQGEVDKIPYHSHEDLSWAMSLFQRDIIRGCCSGRIGVTGSIYYPLQCECGTVISSLTMTGIFGGGMCAKFSPNQIGQERLNAAKAIARQQHISLSRVNPDKLPRLDQNYAAEMNY